MTKHAEFDLWEHVIKKRTHEDRRSGPLPGEWRRPCEDAGRNYTDQPFDRDGVPHLLYFEEIETGFSTIADPRHSLEALRAKGVNIKEFILI